MAHLPLPAPAELRQQLRYEPTTGKIYWRPLPAWYFADEAHWKSWSATYAGRETLATRDFYGYLGGSLRGKRVKAHRVAWALYYGEWPVGVVDHINRVKDDNRIENLRVVTKRQNMQNAKRREDNTSGVTGVRWDATKNGWTAYTAFHGRQIHLGRYDTKAEAIAARRGAEIVEGYHPESRD